MTQDVVNNELKPYEDDSRHAYLEWLEMETRLLRLELYGKQWADTKLTPSNTFAKRFHFPPVGSWEDVPTPSTRAETVLRAVGVQFPNQAVSA